MRCLGMGISLCENLYNWLQFSTHLDIQSLAVSHCDFGTITLSSVCKKKLKKKKKKKKKLFSNCENEFEEFESCIILILKYLFSCE